MVPFTTWHVVSVGLNWRLSDYMAPPLSGAGATIYFSDQSNSINAGSNATPTHSLRSLYFGYFASHTEQVLVTLCDLCEFQLVGLLVGSDGHCATFLAPRSGCY